MGLAERVVGDHFSFEEVRDLVVRIPHSVAQGLFRELDSMPSKPKRQELRQQFILHLNARRQQRCLRLFFSLFEDSISDRESLYCSALPVPGLVTRKDICAFGIMFIEREPVIAAEIESWAKAGAENNLLEDVLNSTEGRRYRDILRTAAIGLLAKYSSKMGRVDFVTSFSATRQMLLSDPKKNSASQLGKLDNQPPIKDPDKTIITTFADLLALQTELEAMLPKFASVYENQSRATQSSGRLADILGGLHLELKRKIRTLGWNEELASILLQVVLNKWPSYEIVGEVIRRRSGDPSVNLVLNGILAHWSAVVAWLTYTWLGIAESNSKTGIVYDPTLDVLNDWFCEVLQCLRRIGVIGDHPLYEVFRNELKPLFEILLERVMPVVWIRFNEASSSVHAPTYDHADVVAILSWIFNWAKTLKLNGVHVSINESWQVSLREVILDRMKIAQFEVNENSVLPPIERFRHLVRLEELSAAFNESIEGEFFISARGLQLAIIDRLSDEDPLTDLERRLVKSILKSVRKRTKNRFGVWDKNLFDIDEIATDRGL